jgi:alpha-1,3-glucan synthase
LFFGCNFGEEAGAATEVWVLRACIVQGLQQIWVSALWYWGAQLTGQDPDDYVSPRFLMYVVWPLAIMSLLFAYAMFWGLPDYYRQVSARIRAANGHETPANQSIVFRRRLVIWFLIAEVLRNVCRPILTLR